MDKFDPAKFEGKPARIGHSQAWPEVVEKTGRGYAQVKFHVQFGLLDRSNKYVTAAGRARVDINVWEPRFTRNDPRFVMLGSPEYNEIETHKSTRTIAAIIDLTSFTESPIIKGLLHVDLFSKPIRLRIDVAEWRYNYKLTWGNSFWTLRTLYENHLSQYGTFNLYGEEKILR
jgi:hypothetical protein